MTIAATILAQLGGNRFLAMTGAKNLVSGENSLSFDAARKRIVITLVTGDQYKVAAFRWNAKALEMRELSTIHGVFVSTLRAAFERQTGLRASL